ncbi:hypothetical protein E2C01_084527 [Portunus trituberculatus]|uniref:Uncharacterized protein n=1 Tax=Portunus trituberculatus TaxID=210409 RepID=A0A5B7J527_PORTR|nr:hypothetical protein [Portunus trituberculatus]
MLIREYGPFSFFLQQFFHYVSPAFHPRLLQVRAMEGRKHRGLRRGPLVPAFSPWRGATMLTAGSLSHYPAPSVT